MDKREYPDWFKQILKNWEKLDAEYAKKNAKKKK